MYCCRRRWKAVNRLCDSSEWNPKELPAADVLRKQWNEQEYRLDIPIFLSVPMRGARIHWSSEGVRSFFVTPEEHKALVAQTLRNVDSTQNFRRVHDTYCTVRENCILLWLRTVWQCAWLDKLFYNVTVTDVQYVFYTYCTDVQYRKYHTEVVYCTCTCTFESTKVLSYVPTCVPIYTCSYIYYVLYRSATGIYLRVWQYVVAYLSVLNYSITPSHTKVRKYFRKYESTFEGT